MSKPVIAYVAGLSAPKGRRMGHASAIISAFGESAPEKVEILREVGATIKFNKATAGDNAELLGVGWHNFETAFTWSRGQHSVIRLASTGSVQSLVLDIGPNPAIPAQTVIVSINGTMVFEGHVAPNLQANVGHVWRVGGQENIITLQPSASGTVGDDPRDLGIALVSIRLV